MSQDHADARAQDPQAQTRATRRPRRSPQQLTLFRTKPSWKNAGLLRLGRAILLLAVAVIAAALQRNFRTRS